MWVLVLNGLNPPSRDASAELSGGCFAGLFAVSITVERLEARRSVNKLWVESSWSKSDLPVETVLPLARLVGFPIIEVSAAESRR